MEAMAFIYTFNENERKRFGVPNYGRNETMTEITRFDLNVSFNMRSLADVEACANALAEMFHEALLEQLITMKIMDNIHITIVRSVVVILMQRVCPINQMKNRFAYNL